MVVILMFVGGANETFSGFGGFGKYPQGEKRSEKMVLRSPCRNWMRREACHRQNQCGGKSRDCGGGRTSKCSVNHYQYHRIHGDRVRVCRQKACEEPKTNF